MKRLAVAAAALLLAAACERPADPATDTAPVKAVQPPIVIENDNLLNLVFGGAVVERNNELNYEDSVAHALDATSTTAWRSAPGGKLSGTFSLAARTKLGRVGVTVGNDAPAAMRVETSLDGKSWQPLIETNLDGRKRDPQLFDARGTEALFLRFNFPDRDYHNAVLSLYVTGSETAPALRPPLAGCWTINHTMPAKFEQRGARVYGTIDDILVDGGSDGRFYRVMWREGMQWGYAAVSVSADGNHLSGVRWHEEVNPKHNGDGWLGVRVPCTDSNSLDSEHAAKQILDRATLWRIYGLRLDRQNRVIEDESTDALQLAAKFIRDNPNKRFQLVAREFREPSEERNRASANAILEAAKNALAKHGADLSRVATRNAGTERHHLSVDFTSLRVMDSCVELQVLPPQ